MNTKERILTFRPDAQIEAAMEQLRERDGIPLSEQIRRALRFWLTEKGMMPPTLSARAQVGAVKRRVGKVVDQRLEWPPKKK